MADAVGSSSFSCFSAAAEMVAATAVAMVPSSIWETMAIMAVAVGGSFSSFCSAAVAATKQTSVLKGMGKNKGLQLQSLVFVLSYSSTILSPSFFVQTPRIIFID